MVFAALGDRVPRWLTINEAKIIAQQGYQYGRMAPGKSDMWASGRVIHHLNLAHGQAVSAFRASPAIGQIGPCLQLAPCYPADASPEAAAAATAADTVENTLYLEPLLRGHYPSLSHTDRRFVSGLDERNQGWRPIRHRQAGRLSGSQLLLARWWSTVRVSRSRLIAISSAGWQQIYPEGIYDILTRLRRDYGSPGDLDHRERRSGRRSR